MSRVVPLHWFWLLVSVAAVLPAAFTLDPALDHDIWWHAAAGRWMAEHRTVPDVDPFSRLGRDEGVRWVAYSWLFELIAYPVLDRFGPSGVLVFRSILCSVSTSAVLALIAARWGRSIGVVLVLSLSAVVLMPLMKERPWHISILFTTVTTAAVLRMRDGKSAVWLPLLFVAWANLHVQFVVGWLVLALGVLFPGASGRKRMAVQLVLCVAAVLVNPYHVRLFGVIVEYATQTAPRELVEELAPLDWRSPWAAAVLGLVLVTAPAAVKRRDGFALVFLAVAVLMAVAMRRDVWLVAVAAAAAGGVVGGWKPVPFLAAVMFAVARLSSGQSVKTDRYPVAAVEYVREHHPPGPLFNPFDWGGYLIWALPDHPVSVDGRTNIYGDVRLRRNFATWAGDGWRSDPVLAASNVVVAPADWPLTRELRTSWQVVYEDRTAVVFVR